MTTLHDKSDTFIRLHIKLLFWKWNGQHLPACHLFSSTLHYNFNAIEMLQFAKDFLFKIYIWFSNIGIFVVCSSVVMEVEVYHFFFWMKASSSHCITKYYFRQSKELHLSLNCFWVDLWLVFVTLDVILWHDRTAAGPALSLLYIYV